MKTLKMVGLAVTMAMGLMAFIGAGTASATTITNGNNTLAVGAVLEASLKPGTSAELKNTENKLIATCTESEVKGFISVATGEWVEATVKKEDMAWRGCSQKTETMAGGSLHFRQIGEADEAEVWGSGTKVTLGVFGVSCVYGTAEGVLLGIVKGGVSVELSVNASLPKVEGGLLCPISGVWTAKYIITSPKTFHIVK
jgi:hypothetical protein